MLDRELNLELYVINEGSKNAWHFHWTLSINVDHHKCTNIFFPNFVVYIIDTMNIIDVKVIFKQCQNKPHNF